VGRLRREPLLARADLLVSDVTKTQLETHPDTEPHPRHANIGPFPSDEVQVKERTVELANAATLVMKPTIFEAKSKRGASSR